jgi:hypothetical protein
MRLFPAAILLLFTAPLAAQTAPSPATLPAPSPADIARFEQLLDRSLRVVVGTVESVDAARHAATIKCSMNIYENNHMGGFVSSFLLPFPEAAPPAVGTQGIFFVEPGASDKPATFTLVPSDQQEKIIAVAEPWLEHQIVQQLKVLEAAYKADPDGDRPETIAAARRIYSLGMNQWYFPAYKTRSADHPARGHLAELFNMLHADLGIPAYLKTPEDKARAIDVLKNAGDTMIAGAATRAATQPFTDNSFDQMAIYFLSNRFSILRDTLAADDDRFKSDLPDWLKRLPDGDKLKPTRMNIFKALLAAQLQGAK